MARFEYKKLTAKKRREMLDRLTDIFSALKKREEIRYFLERLLTESEIVMLARRFEIAEMLVAGRSYDKIQRNLKVGISTIIGVDRWLTDAAYEYQLIREAQKEAAKAAEAAKRSAEKRRLPSTIPGTLSHAIRHDSRLILFRLLLGDF